MNRFVLMDRFLRGNRRYYLLAILAIIINAAMSAILPLITRTALDNVIGGQPLTEPDLITTVINRIGGIEWVRANLWILLVVIVALTLIQGATQFLRVKMTALVGENSARQMRERLYRHILHLPYDAHVKAKTGDWIQRCSSDVETSRNFIANQSVEAIAIIIQTSFILYVMFSLDTHYSLIAIVLLPITLIFTYMFFRKMMKYFLESDEAEGEISATLQENLTGVRVVKAFAAQKLEINKFESKNRKFTDLSFRINRLFANFWTINDFISMAQFVLVLVIGTYFLAQGRISVGTLIAFGTYSMQMNWPLRGLGRILGFMGQAFVSLKRLQEILDIGEEDQQSGLDQIEIKGQIEFDNVRFGYDASNPILDGVSFTVPAGTTTAILGATGAGKSSLVHLLLRLYDYQDGSIRLDGVELSTISREFLRENIGIVLQEPFLFSRTIDQNIRVGHAGTSDDDVRQAARIAHVDDAITEFQDGYQTIIGERGVTLSGGQRQRVAIARTLVRDVPVLIFDDVLSAVDTETDAAIRHALRERRSGTTTLIISHRITTLAEADQIIVLEGGKVVQRGTHDRLIAEEGLYKRVWELQSQIEEIA